ncbi:MAG TPA: hypothetical protein VF922_01045 [Bradyrhizobium sp.]|jgi:hypothetical protein
MASEDGRPALWDLPHLAERRQYLRDFIAIPSIRVCFGRCEHRQEASKGSIRGTSKIRQVAFA